MMNTKYQLLLALSFLIITFSARSQEYAAITEIQRLQMLEKPAKDQALYLIQIRTMRSMISLPWYMPAFQGELQP
jgi:hypothetical protein